MATTAHTQKRHNERTSKSATLEQIREMSTMEAAATHFREFARDRPEIVAMWAFGVGFVLGWKLRIF